MSAIMLRLREYARLTNTLGAWGLLVSFWGVFLVAFSEHMAPRFTYLAGRPIGDDLPCHKPECDFSTFWPAGMLARTHDYITVYAAHSFVGEVNRLLPPSPNVETFFYPPTMLPLVAAISHLPFETGAFLWMFVPLFLAAVLLRNTGLSWSVIVAGLLSPAALFSTQIAQLGVLGGALLVAGLCALEQRPFAAGGMLGLMAAKPQIGILVPFVLLRRRRALVAFAATALALVVLAVLQFGLEPWRAYLTYGRTEMTHKMGENFDPHGWLGWGISVYWLLRSLGVGVIGAMAVQAAIALICVTVLLWLQPKCRGADFTEIAVYLSLLATPYGNTYDMVAYSLVLAEAARRRSWRIGMLDTVLWLWPGFCLVVSIATGVLLTPVFVLAALLRAALRARAAVLPPRPTGA